MVGRMRTVGNYGLSATQAEAYKSLLPYPPKTNALVEANHLLWWIEFLLLPRYLPPPDLLQRMFYGTNTNPIVIGLTFSMLLWLNLFLFLPLLYFLSFSLHFHSYS